MAWNLATDRIKKFQSEWGGCKNIGKYANVSYGWYQSLKKYWYLGLRTKRALRSKYQFAICEVFGCTCLVFFIIKVFLLFQVFWLTKENTKTWNMERPVAIQRPQTALLTKYEKLVCLSYWVQVWPPCRFWDYFYSFA